MSPAPWAIWAVMVSRIWSAELTVRMLAPGQVVGNWIHWPEAVMRGAGDGAGGRLPGRG